MLARAVASGLRVEPLPTEIERFPDGETHVQLLEPVRRREVYLIQSTAPPVNEHLLELLALLDACRRAGAGPVTAIVPYFGYARSDKRHGRREPVAASMVAVCLQALGVNQVVTLDLHAPQIEGFFQVPVDNLTAVPTLCEAVKPQLPPQCVVVAPDAGAVKLASEYARRLGAPVAVLHKQRESGVETRVTHLVGDVRDRPCLIVDDMISTGGTLREAMDALLGAGAREEIVVAATHAVFSGDVRGTMSHPALRRVYVTDTIHCSITDWPELRVVSVAPLLSAAIERFTRVGSISDLF